MNKKNLWQAVLAQIELEISPANFATWFKNTKIIDKDKEKIVIGVPNSFVQEWLENKYKKDILKILHSLKASIKEIGFITEGALTIKNPRHFSRIDTEQLSFETFQRNKETGLNPRYMFDNFIVGSFNELAHAAAIAVSKQPGTLYNPLFIYGKVGLGKTHLLQAIGNELNKNFPRKKVKYLVAERFISAIITSIRNGTIENLKNEYRQIDMLIVDDVQFLAGKEKTQEEFFHIFNALYQKNKQIILSSDRSPKSINALTRRLRSRFEGGMIADISFPDLETRIAILKSKSQEKNLELQEETYNLLATNIQTNIRELEGALNRIVLYKRMQENHRNVSTEEIKNLIKEMAYLPQKKITPKKVIQIVAEFYDIKESDIVSRSRKKEIVKPRQVAMYFLRTKLKNSYPYIARKFGGKDHTTVIYAYRKIAKQLEKDDDLKKDINLIQMRFLSV